tara:strand:+ start:11167 stop:11322 length:156 start_codon:yes stop_codon:yes gene_type:complete
MAQSNENKVWMAYNHNDTPLMKSPASLEDARAEADAYTYATGNAAYVDKAK